VTALLEQCDTLAHPATSGTVGLVGRVPECPHLAVHEHSGALLHRLWFYEPRTGVDLGRDPRISRPPPLRQPELPLQRRQIRSPAQALSKTILHLRHARDLRQYSPGSRAFSVVIHDIWGRCSALVSTIASAISVPVGELRDSSGLHSRSGTAPSETRAIKSATVTRNEPKSSACRDSRTDNKQ
jgi:hypothetical protein